MKTTVSPVYVAAKAAIDAMTTALVSSGTSNLSSAIVTFEDTMNGLSGAILGLDDSLQLEIQNKNEAIVSACADIGYEVSLFVGILPKSVSHGTIVTVAQQGKKLYPLTTTVMVSTLVSDNTGSTGSETGVSEDADVLSSLTSDSDSDIDPIFDENDSDVVVVEPLSTIQNETAPYLSFALIELARIAAANAGGLQDGLTTFSHNPLANVIETTRDLLLYYTKNNYANLNVALSGIYTDPLLNVEYKALREAMGGPDGLSGCVSEMDFFLEHTNRLSGLVLDSNSPNATTDNESREEFITINDFSGGPSLIFSFDSRYFRSAKYIIQATGGALDRGHQTTEIVILHDNFHTYTRESFSVLSQDPFITFTSRLANNRVEVLATTTAANTDFVIHGVKLRLAGAQRAYSEISQQAIIQQHESLASILNDDIDYVALQSVSLTRADLVGNLARLLIDMLSNFQSADFAALPTVDRSSQILSIAANIVNHRLAIQDRIDSDYSVFVELRKLVESLDIAYNLAVAYTSPVTMESIARTLNTVTIAAINDDNTEQV